MNRLKLDLRRVRHSIFLFSTFISLTLHLQLVLAATDIPSVLSGTDLMSGKQIEISLKESKLGTVVTFLSVKCPCSNKHEPRLDKLALTYEKAGFKFIGIHSNIDEDFSMAQEHFRATKHPFPIIQDNQAKIADLFEASKTPHAYIISPELKILFRGGIDSSKIKDNPSKHYLRDALDALMNGESILENNVRVIGCEIKRP